jgi:hypothetical protein
MSALLIALLVLVLITLEFVSRFGDADVVIWDGAETRW